MWSESRRRGVGPWTMRRRSRRQGGAVGEMGRRGVGDKWEEVH